MRTTKKDMGGFSRSSSLKKKKKRIIIMLPVFYKFVSLKGHNLKLNNINYPSRYHETGHIGSDSSNCF